MLFYSSNYSVMRLRNLFLNLPLVNFGITTRRAIITLFTEPTISEDKCGIRGIIFLLVWL